MTVESSYVTALDQCVEALVRAESPSDIFKTLLKGSQCAAPRGAVYLVRQGVIKGWGSIGYDENVARAQRAYRSDADQGWLGQLLSDPETGIQSRAAGGDPDFGQEAPSDSAAIAIRVKGRAIAVLTVERSSGDATWIPQALALLVTVAQLRLELDLALRKLKPGSPGVTAEPAEPVAAVPAAESVPEPLPAATEVTLEFDAEEQSTEIDEVVAEPRGDVELAAARRFAKLVATDIRLYNEEAVMAGRRDGDLADRLAEQLGRGKETFLKRHGALGSAALEILHQAYVEVLAAGNEELLPVSVVD